MESSLNVDDWKNLSECIYKFNGKRVLLQEELVKIFSKLPVELQIEGRKWGMADGLWQDKFIQHYKTLK